MYNRVLIIVIMKLLYGNIGLEKKVERVGSYRWFGFLFWVGLYLGLFIEDLFFGRVELLVY